MKRTEVKAMPDRPKKKKEYLQERRRIFYDIYLKYLETYHKQLLWVAGGAFAVSYSAMQLVAKQPDGSFKSSPWSIGYLMFGWLCLVLAVIVEIGSPYATSRMASDHMESLRLLHENREDEATERKLKSEGWGQLTRYLNENAYRILVLGIWYLMVYVALNLVQLHVNQ